MKTAVVICPGRGTYNATELGYLKRNFRDSALLDAFDQERARLGQTPLSALDAAERFSLSKHTRGDNASGLIFAATYGDFAALSDEIEVVAVTGNSMGWYSALACAGAVTPQAGFHIANTMGTYMQEAMIGGQLLYPWVDEDWLAQPDLRATLTQHIQEINARVDHDLTLSIDLGGMLVLAGNEAGLAAFEAAVPPSQARFPMRLGNHAGFHSAMQRPVSERGRATLGPDLFGQPSLPMIDGRGQIWWPGATSQDALWDYTLGHQVVESYGFTQAVQTAAKEFAPDLFIITGPGTTLGGAVAQSLILADWQGMKNKHDFKRVQDTNPLLVSMGIEAQRGLVTERST